MDVNKLTMLEEASGPGDGAGRASGFGFGDGRTGHTFGVARGYTKNNINNVLDSYGSGAGTGAGCGLGQGKEEGDGEG